MNNHNKQSETQRCIEWLEHVAAGGDAINNRHLADTCAAMLRLHAEAANQPATLTDKQRLYLAQAWPMLEDYATIQRTVGNDSIAAGAWASAHVIKEMLVAPLLSTQSPGIDTSEAETAAHESWNSTYFKCRPAVDFPLWQRIWMKALAWQATRASLPPVTREMLWRWKDKVNTLASLHVKADRHRHGIELKTEIAAALAALEASSEKQS